MASFTRVLLSGSTDGKPIKVAATGTPGTTIHTAAASPTLDHVYALVTNTDTVDRDLTIEFGGTTDPDHLIAKAVPIPAKSHDFPILIGQPLTNSLAIKAFASSANKLLITGWVDRHA
jgi:hypothetical protein